MSARQMNRAQPIRRIAALTSTSASRPYRPLSIDPPRAYPSNSITRFARNASHKAAPAATATRPDKTQQPNIRNIIQGDLATARQLRDRALTEPIPSEEGICEFLRYCKALAETLTNPEQGSSASEKSNTAASALLSLDESRTAKTQQAQQSLNATIQSASNELSKLAYELLLRKTVFISPEVLHDYVELQAVLGKPETLPEVLTLYSTKPYPLQDSNPVRYQTPNPDAPKSAVAPKTASRALDVAIQARDLNIAMEIVDKTYSMKAFHRAKFIREAMLPLGAISLLPGVAYVIAMKYGEYQTIVDPQQATNVATIGIMCYLGFTGTIGWVALATANDQMVRVTWALGMPLRYRWIREDERAAIDRIAQAWGFKEPWRRGEEEGEEWEILREWIGAKGMVLDKVSLMEGME